MRKVFYTSLSMFTHYCNLWLREHELLPIYRCYTNEHILKAYSAQWWPLGNEATIPPSDEAWTLIPDPTTIRAKGWPKSTKIRNEMDWVEPSDHRQKCSRCGAEGHNRRRCPMQSDRGSNSFNWFMYVRWVTCIGLSCLQCIHFVGFNEIVS